MEVPCVEAYTLFPHVAFVSVDFRSNVLVH